MRKFAVVSVFAIVFAVAADPFDFSSYTQSVSLEFASKKEAQAAELVPRGLPANYDLAFSSRWDDGPMSHLNTFKIMKKYGAKGNFYINRDLNGDISVLRHIVSDGCLVGAHTVHHYPMRRLAANVHFYEYMANRIAAEVRTQTPVNTQTSPYGNITGDLPEGTQSIGRALMAAGIIGSPDSSSPEHLKLLGYPENSCAFMYRIVPGDRVPDLQKLETTLANYLKMKELKKDPAISMSTHSWHTKKGLPLLDECYKRLTSHKNWWNCNQNEYAAYRYEALNTTVTKKVTGKSVTFTIQRFEPFELGANVPLYFDIKGAKALASSSGSLENDGTQLKMEHGKTNTLPSKYGYKKLDGVELSLSLRENDGTLTATVSGENSAKVTDITFTFRKAPKYDKLVERVSVRQIKNGTVIAVDPGKISRNSYHYTVGKPYFAVQMDYFLDGRRCRLYADHFGKAAQLKEKAINEMVVLYERPENWNDGAKLSDPANADQPIALKKLPPVPETPECTPGSIYKGKNTPRTGYIGIADIICNEEKEHKVRIHSDKNGAMYFNGTLLPKRKTMTLKFRRGKNRLLLLDKRDASHVFNILENSCSK